MKPDFKIGELVYFKSTSWQVKEYQYPTYKPFKVIGYQGALSIADTPGYNWTKTFVDNSDCYSASAIIKAKLDALLK